MSVIYLLETNVVLALLKPKPHRAVLQWIEQVADVELRISPMTIGAIQAGIEIARTRPSQGR